MRDTRSISEKNPEKFENIRKKIQCFFEKNQVIPANTRAYTAHELSRITNDDYIKINESIAFFSKMESCLNLGFFRAFHFDYQFPFLQERIDNLNDLLSKTYKADSAFSFFRMKHGYVYKEGDVSYNEYMKLSESLEDYKNAAKLLLHDSIGHLNEYKQNLDLIKPEIEKLYLMLIFSEEDLHQISYSI